VRDVDLPSVFAALSISQHRHRVRDVDLPSVFAALSIKPAPSPRERCGLAVSVC